MRTRARTLIATAALSTLALTGAIMPAAIAAPTPTTKEVIHEDDPRWDCRTMGNRQCGRVLANGALRVIIQFDETGTKMLWVRTVRR